MQTLRISRLFRKDRRLRTGGIAALCFVAGLALVGPSGLLSWSEALSLRDARAAQLATLTEKRDALQHRVSLLAPDAADPDLVSELIRQDLNVVRPDEKVIMLEDTPE